MTMPNSVGMVNILTMTNSVGMVNFPACADSPEGTFVELWVLDDDDRYFACCGGGKVLSYSWCEEFAGSDIELGFDANAIDSSPFMLACITMGSANWANSGWRCTYNDLDRNGKAVYDAIKAAYPGAKLVLVTWIDT